MSGAKRARPAAGFTLIELLVVLAIIVVITSIVLTNQSSFNKTLVLANTAYDIALTLRSAETYGLGSRAVAGASNVGYGVDFQRATPGVPYAFTFFVDSYPPLGGSGPFCHPVTGTPSDRPGNCAYDANQQERVVDYTMNNGITVNDFCAYNTDTSSWSCAVAHGGGLSSLDIVFARPNPDEPFISVDGAYSSSLTSVCLSITSSQGGTRSVMVTASGDITTSAAACP